MNVVGRARYSPYHCSSYALVDADFRSGCAVGCTTELGYVARLKPESDKRSMKVIGLSIDPVSDHKRWVGTSPRHKTIRSTIH
ncbi:redoxin domain-containing protein [Mycetohabitans sp. B46]